MPSSYSNLNFHDKWDLSRWKQQCAEQRRIAETWPAFDPHMLLVDEYNWRVGPWHLGLVLEIWQKPYVWHCWASIFEQIGYETVAVDEGLYKGGKIEVPQDALLAVRSWEPEHFEQARFIMAEALGPILRAGDTHQRALEHRGSTTLHWIVRYEGDEPWQKAQD